MQLIHESKGKILPNEVENNKKFTLLVKYLDNSLKFVAFKIIKSSDAESLYSFLIIFSHSEISNIGGFSMFTEGEVVELSEVNIPCFMPAFINCSILLISILFVVISKEILFPIIISLLGKLNEIPFPMYVFIF